MEKGCILPENKLQELQKNEVVVSALSTFCNSPKDELLHVLKTRNQIIENKNKPNRKYGYISYSQKKGKKERTINVPNYLLKKIQKVVQDRLLSIPVSLSATAGKPGDNIIKNVLPHINHPYLLTMDIKNAYPSISTHRVYKNLQGALSKPINIWFPYLANNNEYKDLFMRGITHLCVYQNMLPQGAPTSTPIFNIVMSGLDSKLNLKLPNMLGQDYAYTRYADDIAISFKSYATKDVLIEKINYLRGYIRSIDSNTGLEEIKTKIKDISFIVSDKSEKTFLRKHFEIIKAELSDSTIIPISGDMVFKIIGMLDTYKDQVTVSEFNIITIKNQIYRILSQEGRTINDKKTKIWTPHSNSNREITGLSIDKEGKIGLSKKRKSEYIRLFDDLGSMSIEELYLNDYYRKNFFQDDYLQIEKVLSKVDGIFKGYITQIYGKLGNVPRHLAKLYQIVKDRFQHSASDNLSKLKVDFQKLEEIQTKKSQALNLDVTKENDLPF